MGVTESLFPDATGAGRTSAGMSTVYQCAGAQILSTASASRRFSRVFSSSSVFSRLASETSVPPNFAFHL